MSLEDVGKFSQWKLRLAALSTENKFFDMFDFLECKKMLTVIVHQSSRVNNMPVTGHSYMSLVQK